jgi:hypothetical protein
MVTVIHPGQSIVDLSRQFQYRTPRSLGGALLIYDTFTDTDGTAIASHTIAPTNIPATSWANGGITPFTIIGNQAGSTTVNANNAHAVCNPGIADCIITCDATASSTANNDNNVDGIAARWTSGGFYWRIGVHPFRDLFLILERNNSVDTLRASTAMTITPGSTYAIVVTLSGSTISATCNGANAISYNGATMNQTVTRHGICISRALAADSRIDNFQVYTL